VPAKKNTKHTKTKTKGGLRFYSLRSKRFRIGLKYFSLFERAKLGAVTSVLRSPQFSRRQKVKNALNGRKTYGNACYTGYRF